jgi:RNA polymerase sigma factor (sigma-70 family)
LLEATGFGAAFLENGRNLESAAGRSAHYVAVGAVERTGAPSMQDQSTSGPLLAEVRTLFTTGTSVGLTDRDLLARFLDEGRDSAEGAFRLLVERHGPMVLRVCRQALKDPHAAEDAFQATFLVLARQARSIRKRDSVKSWLFGVACRAAARIRMAEARRHRYERRGANARQANRTDAPDAPERWSELHAGIARLPEKYRAPILLCYFDGLTHEEAAGRLGWPVGTVKTRLSRARDQLRLRLDGRAGSLAAWISTEPLRPFTTSDVPRLLVDSTSRAAAGFVTGAGCAGFTSSGVRAIAQGVLEAMLIDKLRLTMITLLGVVALGMGAMVVARQVPGRRQPESQAPPASPKATDDEKPGLRRLPGTTEYDPSHMTAVRSPFDNSRVDQVLVELGATVKQGDPLLELFSAELATAKSDYELACGQWQRDKKVYDYKAPLAANNTLPKKELIDAENDEAQSRLKMRFAKEKLLGFGLSEAEIASAVNEEGIVKGRMILRARGGGVVIKESVVQGNVYTARDELMVIVPLDHLWVRGHISGQDADNLRLGQPVKVIFPFSDLDQAIPGKIGEIEPAVNFATRTLTFRTRIPNPGGRVKPGALARIFVDLGAAAKSPRVTEAPAARRSQLSLEDRLSEVERKLERLLDERDGRTSDARILERLRALERKLDRVLDEKAR